MIQTPPDEFIALTSILTGFTTETLSYAHQSADFYGTFSSIYGQPQLAALLSAYTALEQAGKTNHEIGETLLDKNSPFANAAQALTVFWYLGQVAPHDDPTSLQIPSSNLYAQGLAWRAVQAHPTGVSHGNFGYWHTPPAPLDDYL